MESKPVSWNRRRIGNQQETKVQEYLQIHGYEIVARNFYTKHGEIDLIAKKDDYLVFIEVKYRADERFGAPEAAVDFRKQRKIIAAAQYYLYKNRIPFDTPCRFDVAGVIGNEIRITENAFCM
ncbi:MAG: YraN family protein [Lachnospiraceae bacterium]|nr:YraN family protein [Lachnospiraceae bacterium]